MSSNTALNRRVFLSRSALGGLSLAAISTMPASAIARALQPEAAPEVPETIGLIGWSLLQEGILAHADLSMGGNTMLIASEGSALLVDTKFPYVAGALLKDAAAQIEADITGEDSIELTLINTHHHADHTGGNAIIVPIAAASYAHANALPRIRDQHEWYSQAAQGGPAHMARSKASDEMLALAKSAAEASSSWTEKTSVPKIGISGSSTSLRIGEIAIQIHHFGTGHTDNDLVVHLPEHNVVHTGDLVFNGTHPFFDQDAKATAKGWINSLQQIRKLCNAETTVIPGHGPIAGPELIDTQISYFEQIIEAIQAEIDKGTSKDELVEMSWAFMDGLSFEHIRGRMIAGVYDELTS